MKKSILPVLSTTASLFIAMVIHAQNNKVVSDSQVKKSIQTFVNLVDSKNINQFGLTNIAELKSLKAGKQFKKYMIGLDEIENFKQGNDVRQIIKGYPSVEVALVNDSGKIRTSIEFVKKKGNWITTGYGSTPELLILSNAQKDYGNSFVNQGDLIRIPALMITFLAIPSATANGIVFIILENYPRLKLTKGQKLPASKIIEMLVPLAKRHNGLPT
jgi:hypothetical protein